MLVSLTTIFIAIVMVLYQIFANAKPKHSVSSGGTRPQFDPKSTAQAAHAAANLTPPSTPRTAAASLVLGLVLNLAIAGFVALVASAFVDGLAILAAAFIALLVIGPGGAIVSALVSGRSRMGHSKTEATRTFGEAWPLLQTGPRYSLLLRPFGADGRLLIVRSPRSIWEGAVGRVPILRPLVYYRYTIEQVLQQAFNAELNEAVVALVDQAETKAPPGPIFIQTRNESWQRHIGQLMSIASHIVIVVPPGFDVTQGLHEEIKLINLLGMATKTVVVGAPRVDEFVVDTASDQVIDSISRQLWGMGPITPGNLVWVTSDYDTMYHCQFDRAATPRVSRSALFQEIYVTSLRETAGMLQS